MRISLPSFISRFLLPASDAPAMFSNGERGLVDVR